MNPILTQYVQKENRRESSVFAGFVAGAEGLVSPAGSGAAPWWGAPSTDRGGSRDRFAAERHWRSLTPRHAVLEWMWKQRTESGGGTRLRRSTSQVTKRAVLVWCCQKKRVDRACFCHLSQNDCFYLRFVLYYNITKQDRLAYVERISCELLLRILRALPMFQRME